MAAVERALTPATRIVFVETIANPRTQIADLARIGALCAARGLVYIVDNTMTSPWLFRPKTVGASLVVNALTKYIGGHGNALAGSVTDTGLFDWTRYPNIADNYKTAAPPMWALTQIRKKGLRDWGGTLSADQAHHIAVGAETLALRMERTCANAQALAEFLAAHRKVRAVHYPGLATHPQHALAKALFGALAACCRSSCTTASTASTSSTGYRSLCRRRTWATTARSPFRWRTRSSGKWARRGGRKWASPTS